LKEPTFHSLVSIEIHVTGYINLQAFSVTAIICCATFFYQKFVCNLLSYLLYSNLNKSLDQYYNSNYSTAQKYVQEVAQAVLAPQEHASHRKK